MNQAGRPHPLGRACHLPHFKAAGQAAFHHADDRFAEMCAHANSERALEQSLHIRLYIPFDGMEHIKAGPHRLEGAHSDDSIPKSAINPSPA
jgi:hypothetical protein